MNIQVLFGFTLVFSGSLFGCCDGVLADEGSTTNDSPGIFAIGYTNAYGMITKKAITVESANKNVSASFFTTNIVNFLSSVTNNGQTNTDPPDKTLVDSTLTNAVIMGELDITLFKAGGYLINLKDQGHLPGVSRDSHGNETADVPLASNIWNSNTITYPFLATFQFVLNGDSLTNYYTVIRQSKDSAWQLQRAWRTDTNGYVIKEWDVK